MAKSGLHSREYVPFSCGIEERLERKFL